MLHYIVILSILAPEHLILVAFIVLLLFGGKKIPELMKGLGKGVREFTDAKNNLKDHVNDAMTEQDKDEEIKKLKQQLQQKDQIELPQ